MTDEQYRRITFQIRHAFDLIRPLSHDSQLDETGTRCRCTVATLAEIMESLLEAESEEWENGNRSHLAIEIEPSRN